MKRKYSCLTRMTVWALIISMLIGMITAFGAGTVDVQAAETSEGTEAEITVLDYGNTGMVGDAVLLASRGHYLLMDTGYTDQKEANIGNSKVIRYLKSRGITNIDLYLSHYHNDHYYLLTTIMRDPSIRVGTLYLPANENLKKYSAPQYKGKKWYGYFTKNINAFGKSWGPHSYSEMQEVIKETGQNVVYLTKGSSFRVGDAKCEVIWHNTRRSPAGNYKQAATGFLNNESLVTRVTVGNTRFLTCGDLEASVEKEMISKGVDLRADIVKTNHHSASTSNTANFYKKVRATWAFGTGYSSKICRNNTKAAGTNYVNMKSNGQITFTIRNDEIDMTCSKNVVKEQKVYVDRDGVKHTKTFIFDKGRPKFYTAKMIPAGAAYCSDRIGWQLIKKKYYYYDENGVLLKGMAREIDGKWYVFDSKDGHMLTGWCKLPSGEVYYANRSGACVTGWQTIGGKKYYFYEDAHKQLQGTARIDNAACIFGKDGIFEDMIYDCLEDVPASQNGLTHVADHRYLFKDGTPAVGLQSIGEKTYYFEPGSGIMLTGPQDIDELHYELDEDGVLLRAQFRDLKDVPKDMTGFAQVGEDSYYYKKGKRLKGWQTIRGSRYYFSSNYKMARGRRAIGKKQYFFDQKTGAQVKKGWVLTEAGHWLYVSGKGTLVKGWQTIGGKKYYLNPSDYMMVTGLKKISKKTYGFGEDGALLKGRAVIGDTEYEFDKNGVLKRTIGKVQIEETTEAQTEAQTEIQSTAAAEEPVQAVETKTAAKTESAEAVTQVTTEAVTQTTTEAVTETTTVEEPETVTTTEKREEAAPESQNVEESAAEAAAD